MKFVLSTLSISFGIGLTVFCFLLSLIISVCIYRSYNRLRSREYLSFIPNVWTSLGILGTFVSIVYTLAFRLTDFNNIPLLISQIAPAFVTSIIGILGSIISSVVIKRKFATEDSKEEKLFSEKYTEDTPEILLYKIFTLLQQNKETSENVRLGIEQIHKDYVELSKPRGILDKISSNLSSIDSYENQNMEFLMEYKTDIQENFSSVKKTLYESQTAMIGEMTNQTQKLETFVKELLKGIKQFYSDVTVMARDSTNKLIEDHIVDYKQIFADHNKELNSVEEQAAKDRKNHFESMVNSLNGSVDAYKKGLEDLSNNTLTCIKDNYDKLNERIRITGEAIEKTQKALTEGIENLETNSVNKLGELCGSLVQTTTDNTNKLTETIESVDEKLGKSIEVVVKDWEQKIGETQTQTLEKLNGIYEELVTSSSNNAKTVEQTLNNTNANLLSVTAKTKELWEKNINALKEETNKKLDGIYSQFVEATKQNKEALAKEGGSLVKEIQDRNKEFGTYFKILSESIENMTEETSKEWTGVMVDFQKKMSEEMTRLRDCITK